MRTIFTILAVCCAVIAAANFVAFLADSAHLGGSAGNGYALDGRYFVGGQGPYVEVSEAQWQRNRIQGTSVFLTHPLGMVGLGYLLFTRVFPSKMWRGPHPALVEGVRSIEGDSVPLLIGRCGGRIGEVTFSSPLLKVAIYPSGVVIKPIMMQPFGLSLAELEAVRYDRVSYNRGLFIDHSSTIVQKPIYLHCREDDPLAANLCLLVGRSYRDYTVRDAKAS